MTIYLRLFSSLTDIIRNPFARVPTYVNAIYSSRNVSDGAPSTKSDSMMSVVMGIFSMPVEQCALDTPLSRIFNFTSIEVGFV